MIKDLKWNKSLNKLKASICDVNGAEIIVYTIEKEHHDYFSTYCNDTVWIASSLNLSEAKMAAHKHLINFILKLNGLL